MKVVITLWTLILGAALFSGTLSAANLYKWVDADGNVTYQDSPPPSNVEFEAKEYTDPDEVEVAEPDSALEMEDAARENPVSLYTVPACDVCDLVRLFLESKQVPFVEKNVQSSIPLQQELQSRTGDLSVPTLLVGDKSIDGYSKSAIVDLLQSKGFPISTAAVSEGEDGTEPVVEIGIDNAEDAASSN